MKISMMLFVFVGILLSTVSISSHSHPLDPTLFEITESDKHILEVLWRTPALQPANAPISPVLPARCRELTSPIASKSVQWLTVRWSMDCGLLSLVNEKIGVQGLELRKTDVLIRVHLADGRLIQGVLRPSKPFLSLPERISSFIILYDYLALGFEHILTGLDHLFFVLGLLLLVKDFRPLLWTITAFTIGHSVTMLIAGLNFIAVPAGPVEILIAFSIFIVAVEISKGVKHQNNSWISKFPWTMALLFGFLHGLGFAGALAAVGLPDGEIPLALFSFNIGIELGQLLFIGAVLILGYFVKKIEFQLIVYRSLIPAYIIGSISVMWIFERFWAVI